MTNEKAWELFNEILVENGEPFETERVGTQVCVVRRKGQARSVEIMLDAESGLMRVGSGKQGDWRQFRFNSADEDDFAACAEEAIAEVDRRLSRSGVICRGDVFHARTNAELLNQLLGKNMKGYMKCIYRLTETYALLMHTFNRVTPALWLNREMADGTVIEQFVGEEKIFKGHEGIPDQRFRALFEKRKDEGKFIFRGVYRLSEESTPNRRVWLKIADETNLFDY